MLYINPLFPIINSRHPAPCTHLKVTYTEGRPYTEKNIATTVTTEVTTTEGYTETTTIEMTTTEAMTTATYTEGTTTMETTTIEMTTTEMTTTEAITFPIEIAEQEAANGPVSNVISKVDGVENAAVQGQGGRDESSNESSDSESEEDEHDDSEDDVSEITADVASGNYSMANDTEENKGTSIITFCNT